jgi:3-isopropylmalate dehydrogenase
MIARIALLPGDGIGPEIVAAAQKALDAIAARFGHRFEYQQYLIGGASMDRDGQPLSEATLMGCRNSDAILLGAVGSPRWSDPNRSLRPEHGLLTLRQELDLYANIRPILGIPALAQASPLRPERLENLDLVFVRELSSGIYYGKRNLSADEAFDECRYSADEIIRVVRHAGQLATSRRNKLTLVDKANVLDTSRLWRQVTSALVAREFPQLELEVLLVDAMAMHLLERPASFDVIVTENLFGDILTDEASMLVGSLGVLPSASLGDAGPGLFEPAHGSAPELTGQDRANPVATLLSAAMLLQHGLGLIEEARALTGSIHQVIEKGLCTSDLGGTLGTRAVAEAVIAGLSPNRAVA